MKKNITYSIILILVLVLLNIVFSRFNIRWDFTSDKRYTLSETTKNLLSKIDENIVIDVYLKGDFPLDFKRLQQETQYHLNELKIHNNKLHFRFINPTGMEEKLIKKGLQPSRLTVEEEGSISEAIIFPWAIVKYKDKSYSVPLLIDSPSDPENQLQNSIENLEYSFSKAFARLTQEHRKSIAVLRGHGELTDIYLYDLLKSLQDSFNLAPFSLEQSDTNPVKILEDLRNFDMVLIAKPTKTFSENDKLILDQFILSGGKSLWLIDNTTAEMDSLQKTGESFFVPRDLNLTDLLFSYGVRINYNLVQDLYSSKIAIATGNIGNKTQFEQFLWSYYPLVNANATHPITKNIKAVNLKFPASIDTLANTVHKEILLQSSSLSRVSGTPSMVSLKSIADKVNPKDYSSKPQVFGVLLEGSFTSAYQHRTKAFNTDFIDESPHNKMIVISDGDIIANQTLNGEPTRLDVDKWTGQRFGNKDFLLNTIDYLLDDSGLLNLRGKSLDIKMLNKERVHNDKGLWQFITIILPLILLGLFGFGYTYYRKRKYV